MQVVAVPGELTMVAEGEAAAYERHLQNLTGRTEVTWQQVAELTVFSKPNEYDQATAPARLARSSRSAPKLFADTGLLAAMQA